MRLSAQVMNRHLWGTEIEPGKYIVYTNKEKVKLVREGDMAEKKFIF